MPEIVSDKTAVENYMSELKNAGADLTADDAAISEDAATTLSVNVCSREAAYAMKRTVENLSAHIEMDSCRVIHAADRFEEKDRVLAGKVAK